MNNNTTSKHSTNFLRGVELIEEAHGIYKLGTENWCYPTEWKYGFATDRYYAEIWHDGMDWTSNYWLIESFKFESPKVYPLLYFSDSDERNKFNDYDFGELLNAVMYHRRNALWIHDDENFYNDSVWNFIKKVETAEILESCSCMVGHRFEHASQPRIEFYMNIEIVPELDFEEEIMGENVLEEKYNEKPQ